MRTHDHILASRPWSMASHILRYNTTDVAFSPLGEYWQHTRKLFREMTETNVDLLVGFNLENFIPRWPLTEVLFRLVCWKVQRHLNKWDALLEEVIKEHINLKQDNSADFIHVFLSLQQEYGLTDDNVKSLLMNIFEAAIETSYLVLEYAMAELINNRHVMKKLQTEVRTFASSKGKKLDMITEEDLSSLPYLKATMKEALRLHPPGPLLLPHYSTADCSIDGYDIPAKTRILVNGWAIGRDPKAWERPEEFMPERFLQDGQEKSSNLGQDFKYLPFGSGRRICPGANFALATMEIMLVNLMYHFDWEVPNEKDGAGGKVSMAETFGLMLRRNEKLYLVPRIA
ncbi:unnamed protein product [Triticum turgidum subsp. durum]|uniref:Cytochrome P450 n=1 Tax=Triticum turgidum subsp. durum TaxID=4567 RepID=A0A9R0WXU9_TRITD|nr:unnamed protein product [Triticum turgidum subsp. durum]